MAPLCLTSTLLESPLYTVNRHRRSCTRLRVCTWLRRIRSKATGNKFLRSTVAVSATIRGRLAFDSAMQLCRNEDYSVGVIITTGMPEPVLEKIRFKRVSGCHAECQMKEEICLTSRTPFMKFLIVDDEKLARERLIRLLGRLHPEADCLQANDGASAVAIAVQAQPDIVLLDIQMPGMDGIAVAAELEQMDVPPAIAFCTAYDEYALQALQHQAVAYLLKPVREAELAKSLHAAGKVNRMQLAQLRQKAAAPNPATLVSETTQGFVSVPLDEVRCFIAEDKYITAYTAGETMLINDTLKRLEQAHGDQLVRIHRNALAAVRHIARLQKEPDGNWVAVFEGLTKRPAISRRHLTEVKRRVASG